MPQRLESTAPASRFTHAADAVEVSIGRFLGSLVSSPGLEFSRTVMFGIALLRACADQEELSNRDLTLVEGACRRAAAACRGRGRNAEMLTAAAAFEQAAAACDAPV